VAKKRTVRISYEKRVPTILELVGDGITPLQLSNKLKLARSRSEKILNRMYEDGLLMKTPGTGKNASVFTKTGNKKANGKSAAKDSGIDKHYDLKTLKVHVHPDLAKKWKKCIANFNVTPHKEADMLRDVLGTAIQMICDPRYAAVARVHEAQRELGATIAEEMARA